MCFTLIEVQILIKIVGGLVRVCRGILGRMASNGVQVWKWRRRDFLLLHFMFGVAMLSANISCNADHPFLAEEEVGSDATVVLREQFNISVEHAHALATLLTAPDRGPFLQCLEGLAEGKKISHKFDTRRGEAVLPERCPIDESLNDEKLSSLSGSESISSSQSKFSCAVSDGSLLLKNQISRASDTVYCKGISMLLLKAYWWVFLGMVVNNVVARLCEKKNHVTVQKRKQRKQSQSHKEGGTGRWGRKLLVLWVVSGLSVSIWLFWYMNADIILRRTETLANMCDERARMLQDQFNVSMNHVHALAILVSTFHHGKQPSAIDQRTFAEYTKRTAFERPLTSGVAYALKVLHAEREQFEKEHGFTIRKMEEDQSAVQDEYVPENLDPAPVQNEYAPVIFSQETVSHIVSIDMMSGKEDHENILRARASGKGVLTSPFKLLKSNHLGVVLTFAVYNTELPLDATPEERIAATQGYLGASFDIPSLVDRLLHQLASKQTIVVNVYDTTNASARIKMYGPNVTDTDLWHLSNLDFGDPVRKHEMHCRFKQKPPLPWSAINTAVGVLTIVLLIAHIFHAAINRIDEVVDDYQEMRELKVRAEAADVAKSQFLATVSHEIRTPMNGVLGMLQMLMGTNLDTTQLDYARTAQSSGRSLITLINEVLDQAKIESGRLELEAVPFDVRSIIDSVLSLFFDKSLEQGIELAVFVSDRVPEVLIGDPGRFSQVITNLVGNSIKFTKAGHIFVSVHLMEEVRGFLELNDSKRMMLLQHPDLVAKSVSNTSFNTLSGFPVVDKFKCWESFNSLNTISSAEDTNRFNLLVTVEDTGVGIPREAQSRIFMPFMQADSSTSRTYGGTGIGLSISKHLVELMSGEIGFVSEAGIGSVFAFTTVFTKGSLESMDLRRHQSDPVATEFKGMRALVVDARAVRAEVTKYHMKRLGMQVEIAGSPKSAISDIFHANNSSVSKVLDIVFVDNESLKKEIALEFPRLLKESNQNGKPMPLEKLPKLFLLATSVNPTEIDLFKMAGYADVIRKPLRPSMIAACLQHDLGVVNKNHIRKEASTLQSLLNGKKILVVDDNIVNQRVAAGALKKYGADVTCVDSGKRALSILGPPHEFDACFMDVQMPEMDGFEATRCIRQLENDANVKVKSLDSSKLTGESRRNWHTPILAMTADVIQATHEKCVRCGMDGYVSKPFDEEQLYKAVAAYFESEAEDNK